MSSIARQNLLRPNFQDTQYECNIILSPQTIKPVQQNFILSQDSGGATTADGKSSISVRTNNYFKLTQNSTPVPVLIYANDKEIAEETTEFGSDQFLDIQYFLENFIVSRDKYYDLPSFLAATDRYIQIVYETEYDTNTSPTLTKLVVGFSLDINIIENV